MRWQAAAALAAAAFAAGDFAAAAIAASGASPILDPEAAMAAIPAALRAGRVFSAEAVPLCAGTACACGALLAWARSLGTKGARRDGEEHGSSRWATRKDIAPFGDPKDPDNNIILTDSARIRLVSRRFDLSTDTNDNVLVVGGPGHRQDALLRQAEPPAGQRQLLRDRPEGHAHPRDGRRAGGARLRDPRVRHHRLHALHALQPHSLHTRRGGRHPLRPRHRRQHRGRRRPQGRPLLGEGRAPGLHRAHGLPRHALRARRPKPRRAAHAALARRRPRRPGLHEPARHGVPRAGDRRALRQARRRARRRAASRCAAFPRRTARGSGSRSASRRRPTTSRSRATASSAWPPATP